MAYSCVKVLFEIGHEASIRTKRTPEGFTHDWEIFVRGAENSDIFHFVEKVVFHLHETFPKPKRVVKEPPYSVKESGYAGFNLPIDIYFKNSDEPKKVRFNYDLQLQPTGAPISNVLREEYVFPNPAEDLRRRLIKGGGVGVLGSESGFHLASSGKLPLPTSDETPSHKHPVQAFVGKPKPSGNDSSKKHKVKEGKGDESRVSNSFHDLFGPPIKTAKVSPDPKKSSSHSSPKVSPASKSSKPAEKSSSDKAEKSSKSSKHGSQKEGKESSERSSSKEEKKEKEKSRDKEKNKDKPPKRPSSPAKPPSTPPKRPSTPPKRPPSPKRASSPAKSLAVPQPSKVSSPKHSSAMKTSKDEPKKSNIEDSKSKSELKSVTDSSKSEKKKKEKKHREEKPKKEKHKDHEKNSEKSVKIEKSKDSKDKDLNKKVDKEAIKEVEKTREKDKEKSKHTEGEKEKQKHKHKKKDKSNKDRDKERDRERSSKKSSENKVPEIRDKEKNGITNDLNRGNSDTTNDVSASLKKPASSSPSPSPVRVSTSPVKPSSTPEKSINSVPLKDKIKRPPISDDSSDSRSSALSADEEVELPINRIKSESGGLVTVENKSSVIPVTEPPRPNSRSEIVKPKSENSSQERNSLNKSSSKQKEKSSRKNKERDAGCGNGDKSEKDNKKKRKRSSKTINDGDCAQNNGETPLKIPKIEVESEELPLDPEPLEEKAAVEDIEIKEESEPEELSPPLTTHLTEEYVSQLRELQHKIMTLEDNAELQRVVQVIAETGQYEITKKTFDFDLCALDRSTVQRLQEFFAPS